MIGKDDGYYVLCIPLLVLFKDEAKNTWKFLYAGPDVMFYELSPLNLN